ncbi:MAG TPA: M1 family metallopeptidase [Acidimicrobiia bacterium]|nr:M1 family metallopeptidase [Acidimicrobiia bacterium]
MKRTAVLVVLLVGCTTGVVPPDVAPPATTARVTTTTTAPVGVDAAAGLGDRLFPDLGNAGYDVISYDIDMTLDGGLTAVDATTTVVAEATVPLRSFALDFVGHRVARVAVDEEAAGFHRDGRELRINPRTVIAAGERFVVVVDYDGRLEPVDMPGFPFPTGWQRGADGSRFLLSQPDGASGVFPSNDHPRDRADVRLTVRVPAPHVVVSGGTLSGPVTQDGLDVYTAEIPGVAPYLIPLVIGDFSAVTTDDGVVTWLAGGGDLPPGFERQGEILAVLVEDLGPYPFGSIGAVIVDSGLGAALETQTLPTYTTRSAAWAEPVIAHELAHQWFGNDITLGQWGDLWLNEGFATFMTWRWMERDRGRETYVAETRRAWEALAAVAHPAPADPPVHDLFNLSVYQRAGLGIVALREFVGDEEFFPFLRAYVTAFAGESVTTDTFLTFVLLVLGPDAERLMVEWVRHEGLPEFPVGD